MDDKGYIISRSDGFYFTMRVGTRRRWERDKSKAKVFPSAKSAAIVMQEWGIKRPVTVETVPVNK